MRIKTGLTLAASVAAVLVTGCNAQQMAQFQHDLDQANQNYATRQRACATAADRQWNLYSGAASASAEKSIGSGLYELKVTAQNRSGVCTVSETGMVKGVMNDGSGTYGGQPNSYQSGSSNDGRDYDRGCADAKVGSYDRSGNATKAYEDGWNACRGNGAPYNAPSSVGCPYDLKGNECAYYQDGYRAGGEDARMGMSMAYERHSGAYDSRFEHYYSRGYEAGWRGNR